jgi:hypothetical protein
VSTATPRWLEVAVRSVGWGVLVLLGLGVGLFLAYFLLMLGAVIGYELGFWGPPFGSE